jgi:AcrR family transcriptional regulator
MQILREEGISALTLRNTARKAGVSHSAPYAHFIDKQALLAAISTRGFRDLYRRLDEVITTHTNRPESLLLETGWAYAQFAMAEPALFKLMFSGMLEDEHSHPEFMAAASATYQKLVEAVSICQSAGILRAGPVDHGAVTVWSMVHGFISLSLERQLPGQAMEGADLKTLLANILARLT